VLGLSHDSPSSFWAATIWWSAAVDNKGADWFEALANAIILIAPATLVGP